MTRLDEHVRRARERAVPWTSERSARVERAGRARVARRTTPEWLTPVVACAAGVALLFGLLSVAGGQPDVADERAETPVQNEPVRLYLADGALASGDGGFEARVE
jgi:hypothetical protein